METLKGNPHKRTKTFFFTVGMKKGNRASSIANSLKRKKKEELKEE
jgi:hypothetical protein